MKKGCSFVNYVVLIVFLFSCMSFFVIFSSATYAAPLAGMVSDIPNGESIRVTVMNNNKGCTGICSKTFETAGGYSIDLNYAEGDALTIYAYYEEVLNTNTETATKVPYDLRLSICEPPKKPQLYDLGTIHTTSVSLQWTTENSEYSVVSVDGQDYYEVESPYRLDNLETGNHIWRVKNCNSKCCAKEVEGTFVVSNNVPDKPKFQVTNKGLEITTGKDSDSDTTYIEYRINNGTTVKSNFFDINNMRIDARTCDNFGCSDWETKKITTCTNAGNYVGVPQNDNSSYSVMGDQNGPAINYSDFFTEFNSIMQTKTAADYSGDVSCAGHIAEGVDAVKEIMSTKVNEAQSFVVNTNVPSTVRVGDDVVIDIDFRSDESLENVTFSVISELSFDKKNYDYLVNDDKVNPRLVATSRGMNASTVPVLLRISDYKGVLYTKQFYVKFIYTMSDFEYRLQEIRLQSKGIIDAITSTIVMICVFFVCVVLVFYMQLKKRYKKEMINEAKLQKDRDLALLMLSGKQGVEAIKKDTKDLNASTEVKPSLTVDDLKKDIPVEKTDYEKKVDKMEESRAGYLQKNDDRKNAYFEGK